MANKRKVIIYIAFFTVLGYSGLFAVSSNDVDVGRGEDSVAGHEVVPEGETADEKNLPLQPAAISSWTNVDEISQILFYCPLVRGDCEDEDTNDLILRKLYKISCNNTADIREGIAKFLDRIGELPAFMQDLDRDNVSILNHLIFSIPDRLPRDEVVKDDFVYTWLVVDTSSKSRMYWVFPLGTRNDGSLRIASRDEFIPRNTTNAGVLKEFDFLTAHYKRTDLLLKNNGFIYRKNK